MTISVKSYNLNKKYIKKPKTKNKMNSINSVKEFKKFSLKFQQENGKPFAYGIGIVFKDSKGEKIGCQWYSVNKEANLGVSAVIMHNLQMNKKYLLEHENIHLEISTELIDKMLNEYLHVFKNGRPHPNIDALKNAKSASEKNSRTEAVVIFYGKEETLKKPILNIEDGTFRLALISQSKYKESELCLEKMESAVPNVAWTVTVVGPLTQNNWDKIKHKSEEKPFIGKTPPDDWEIPFFKEEKVK